MYSIQELISILQRILRSEYTLLIEQESASTMESEDLEKVVHEALSRQDEMEQFFNHLAYKPPFF
ncbi:hypothetical protein PRIPAC_80118 [Pristionchus pacificus]|uniref:Uncharacterized protein n=1 Tax=Pristionchus pacificus TaxID=54126 RepID=A0A454XJV7_PRIPA|nr:hypothetical protein PRIPAC_80118 [Pristionchus pacificus]|eukprot:PDM78939.1 hypothetical protein PRIPAC_31518 [Pristionchus pacificus]